MKREHSEKSEYVDNPRMWTDKGDRLTTVGDYLGRLPSIELLQLSGGEKVLDAGCGAGFNARQIARMGAKVYGCDRADKMLAKAIEHESEVPLGIEYISADITMLPYADGFFDDVFCVAVLIHDSAEECAAFFAEAKRVLKPGGKIIISVMHEALYQEGSPNRTGRASWAQYRPLETKPVSESQRFEEDYRDAFGNTFTSTVWHHPKGLFRQQLSQAGLCVIKEQEMYVTQEVLDLCNHAGEVGYPGFYQIMARKPDA